MLEEKTELPQTYISNVFTDDLLEIDESIGMNLNGHPSSTTRLNPTSGSERRFAGANNNYVAISRLPEAQTSTKASHLTKLRNKLGMKKPAKEVKTRELPLYEVILPHEEIAQQWIGPLWPSMDDQLRKLDASSSSINCAGVAWKRQPANVQHIQTDPRVDQPPQPELTTTTASQSAENSGGGRKTETSITTPSQSTVADSTKFA
ncbi:hypothetical protein C8F01DRAFT_1253043 [Mycena amicta]|nr:hypothetical protein C8F01DRAFT_1253043 [Mycena amicta]